MRKLPFLAVALGFVALVVCAQPRPARAQPRETRDDLADRVAASIRRYAHFSIFDDIGVAVTDGSVTLSGCVTEPVKRTDINDRVARLAGVRSVTNDIRVLPVSRYDADLRVRVAQAIYSHSTFWPYAAMAAPPIHIIVEGGRVTLTGRVNTEVERALADALAQVPGAFAVINKLTAGTNR